MFHVAIVHFIIIQVKRCCYVGRNTCTNSNIYIYTIHFKTQYFIFARWLDSSLTRDTTVTVTFTSRKFTAIIIQDKLLFNVGMHFLILSSYPFILMHGHGLFEITNTILTTR